MPTRTRGAAHPADAAADADSAAGADLSTDDNVQPASTALVSAKRKGAGKGQQADRAEQKEAGQEQQPAEQAIDGADAEQVEPSSKKAKRAAHSESAASASSPTESAAARYDVVLLDIEGTTTPISFVKDVLFPYAASHLEEHLASHYREEQTREDVRALIRLSRQESKDGVGLSDTIHSALEVAVIPEEPVYLDASLESSDSSAASSPAYAAQLAAVIDNVRAQMAADKKSGALKQLQGHIWAAGYASGELQGTVYADAVACMRRWHSAGLRVAIYSSGSVEAQKLIFAHTDSGSLTDCISGYFDTAVGAKQDSASYTTIAERLAVQPSRLLFLTDVEGEAAACKRAGCEALIVVREGNKPVDAACGIAMVHSFDEVDVGI